MKKLLIGVLAAMAGFSCAAHTPAGGRPAEIIVGERDAGSTVTLHRGERLAVVLAGNPSTGFSWQLVSAAGPVLAQRGEPEFTRGGSLPGAGGRYRYAFTAEERGEVSLEFIYRRTFEDKPAAATFQVTVKVTD